MHRRLARSQRGWLALGQSALLVHEGAALMHRPNSWSQTRGGWNMPQSCGLPHIRSQRLSVGWHTKAPKLAQTWALLQVQTLGERTLPPGSRISTQVSSHCGQSAAPLHVFMHT
jgi:hypothetical protein